MAPNINPKNKYHQKSRSPSKYPTNSSSRSKSTIYRLEVVQFSPKSPISIPKELSPNYTSESPELKTLIKRLEEISISAENLVLSETFEGSVTSILQGTGVLTRSKSKKLKIIPFYFPLHSQHRKYPISETQTSTNDILSSSSPQTPPFIPPVTSSQTILNKFIFLLLRLQALIQEVSVLWLFLLHLHLPMELLLPLQILLQDKSILQFTQWKIELGRIPKLFNYQVLFTLYLGIQKYGCLSII